MGDLRLGTSGWSYDEWVGPFYENKKTPKLTYYSQIFPTAEIDSTFYAYPSERTVYGWLRHTGSDFVFCAKLPKLLTHDKVLGLEDDVEKDLERFLEVMQPLSLNGKLLAILVQLPPSLIQNLDLLENFFRLLPKKPRFAIEFRHKSWWNDDTWSLLRKYEIANTIVDEPLLPPDPILTTDFAYIRWHGKGKSPWYDYHYSINELKPWVPKIEEAVDKTITIVGYFNNHFHGYAVENCLHVLEMLGKLTPRQIGAKEKAERFINEKISEAPHKGTLTQFISGPTSQEPPIKELISGFMDSGRLRRALDIGDDELILIENRPNLVKVKIREYTVMIDSEERCILHDCPDWERTLANKTFCKHVGKVFLSLPENWSRRILQEISSRKDLWQFSSI